MTTMDDPDECELVALAADRLRLTLLPRTGAAIAGLDWHNGREWVPLLQPARQGVVTDPTKSSLFSMVPWCNRLSAAGVETPDGLLALAPNWPTTPFPVHGFGWLAEWVVSSLTSSAATLTYRHDMEGGYRYRVDLSIELAGDTVSLHLSLTNLGQRILPFGLGFHPYFPRLTGTTLKVAATRQTSFDAMGLPAQSGPVSSQHDFGEARALPSETLSVVHDTVAADIVQPELGYALHLQSDTTLPLHHLWAPAGMPFFCIEPLSHEVDAFSHKLAASRHFVAPGQSIAAGMKLAVEPLSFRHP